MQQTPNISRPPRKSVAGIIGKSKRLTLTYIVLIVWIALAVFAILINANLYALATYFASGLPIILGYLWSETTRPSLTDAAEIIKNIETKGGGSGSGGGISPYNPTNQTPTNPISNIISNVIGNVVKSQSSDTITSIYSDDATVELKVNQNQLKTLQNTGYVDSISGKYTFKKSLLDQIKSLIGDNSVSPNI